MAYGIVTEDYLENSPRSGRELPRAAERLVDHRHKSAQHIAPQAPTPSMFNHVARLHTSRAMPALTKSTAITDRTWLGLTSLLKLFYEAMLNRSGITPTPAGHRPQHPYA